jgi:hypothetical protein
MLGLSVGQRAREPEYESVKRLNPEMVREVEADSFPLEAGNISWIDKRET